VWLTLVALSCGLAACARTDSQRAVPHAVAAEILWLPAQGVLQENAVRPVLVRNGRSIYIDGSGAVVFSIAIKCDDAVRQITEHFAQTEWRPRSTQYLNPHLATSFSSGCQRHGGGVIPQDSIGRPIPPEPDNEWHGEWENGRGDIVSYVVGGTGQQLRGYAEYVPRQMVESGKRNLGR
jgi:hypothetical protein